MKHYNCTQSHVSNNASLLQASKLFLLLIANNNRTQAYQTFRAASSLLEGRHFLSFNLSSARSSNIRVSDNSSRTSSNLDCKLLDDSNVNDD